MKCPACDKEIEFEPAVLGNVERYLRPVVGTTVCCGTMIHVRPYVRYRFQIYEGPDRVDDFGKPAKARAKESAE